MTFQKLNEQKEMSQPVMIQVESDHLFKVCSVSLLDCTRLVLTAFKQKPNTKQKHVTCESPSKQNM